MTCFTFFFAASFVLGASIIETNASEITVVHLASGGNAQLKLPQWPQNLTSLTICSSVYPIFSTRLQFTIMSMTVQDEWISLNAYSVANRQIGISIKGGKSAINGQATGIIFSLKWLTFCLSLDSLTGRIGFALDSQLVLDEIHEDFVNSNWSSFPFTVQLGPGNNRNSRSQSVISNLNIHD